LYTCGRFIYVDQAFPGALITVTLSGHRIHDPVLGQLYAPAGIAVIELNPPLPPGAGLAISQSVGAINGQTLNVPGADRAPLAPGSSTSLAPPMISFPLYRGQTRILVQNVVDGATVTVLRVRLGQPAESWQRLVALDSAWIAIEPAALGDVYGVMQSLPCGGVSNGELASDWSSSSGNQNQVLDAPPPSPEITSTVSESSANISFAGLVPAATVRLFAQLMFGLTKVVGDFQAWSPSCSISLPANALEGAQAVYVGQTFQDPMLAEYWSYSNVVPVAQPQSFEEATLGAAYVGSPLIHISHVPPGVLIGVFSARFDTWVGVARPDAIIDGEADVELIFPLVFNDMLGAFSLGGEPIRSNVQTVGAVTQLSAPVVPSPASDCGGSILVTNVQPGARVEVYRANGPKTFLGQAFATMSQVSVPVPPLADGVRLRARQTMAGIDSTFSADAVGASGADPVLADLTPTTVGCIIAGADSPGFAGNGTDLGVSTDAVVNGRHLTLFFFGDVAKVRSGQTKPVGYTTDSFPTADPCLAMTFLTARDERIRGLWAAPNRINFQLPFNVPTGAFTFNNVVYLFVQAQEPQNGNGNCFLLTADASDILYGSASELPTIPFDVLWQFADASGSQMFAIISPVVIENANWAAVAPGLPAAAASYEYGVFLFGCGPYRGADSSGTQGVVSSVLSLAWMPLTGGGPLPGDTMYWTGNGWSPDQADTYALGLLPPPPGPPGPLAAMWDLGELSVFWDDVLRRWVAFFNTSLVGDKGCAFYYSQTPWGVAQDGAYVWSTVNAGTRDSLVLSLSRDAPDENFLNEYGPYRVLRYGSWSPWSRTRTVFYTVSTNPGSGGFPPPYASYLCRTIFKTSQ
jgi:hypothetical protein